MLAGYIYWEGDRSKRRQYDGLVGEKKKKEKHEAWLRELEARDQEEQELRKIREKIVKGERAERKRLTEGESRAVEYEMKENAAKPRGSSGSIRSALEESEVRREGVILEAVRRLWERR